MEEYFFHHIESFGHIVAKFTLLGNRKTNVYAIVDLLVAHRRKSAVGPTLANRHKNACNYFHRWPTSVLLSYDVIV